MSNRVVRKKRNAFNTLSNRIRQVKTPGGNTSALRRKKRGRVPKCKDCNKTLVGLKKLRPIELSRTRKNKRTGNKPYAGTKCGKCVKRLILKSFLLREKAVRKEELARNN